MPNYTDKEVKHHNEVEIAILVAIILGLIAFLIAWNHYQPERERASYNEGRYGVDRATAVAMAERGIGKSAADVLAEDGK